jgi:hypothetical protein
MHQTYTVVPEYNTTSLLLRLQETLAMIFGLFSSKILLKTVNDNLKAEAD